MVSLHVSSYTTVRGMLLVSLADPTRSVSREHCYVGSSPTGILDQTKLEEGKGRTARSMRSFGSWEFHFPIFPPQLPTGPDSICLRHLHVIMPGGRETWNSHTILSVHAHLTQRLSFLYNASLEDNTQTYRACRRVYRLYSGGSRGTFRCHAVVTTVGGTLRHLTIRPG